MTNVVTYNVSLDQHGEKGTSNLKTGVLEALGLQGWSFSEASWGHLDTLAIAFPLCLSRERQFRRATLSFPRQAGGKVETLQVTFGYLRTFPSTSTVKRAHLSSKLELWEALGLQGWSFFLVRSPDQGSLLGIRASGPGVSGG